MDSFNITELNFTIVNDADNSKDSIRPFSFLDFIQYLQTEYSPEKYTAYYSSYLKKWYAKIEVKGADQESGYKEFYKQFMQEVVLKYTTQTERLFLQKIDYNNPMDLDIAISFYANRLTEIAMLYKSRREEAKYVVERNKARGSVTGIERAIFDNIYNFIVNFSNETELEDGVCPSPKPSAACADQLVGDVLKDFNINVLEYIDVYGDYFDITRNNCNRVEQLDSDEGRVDLREILCVDNIVDIDSDYFFDPDAINILKENTFLQPFGNITINPPSFTEADINAFCNTEDSVFEEINSVYTKGGLSLSQVYAAKRQILSKYASSDFYFINTTSFTPTSGVLFRADAPTNNLLNLQTTDIAAVQSSHQKVTRDVGLFFKPDDIGIFKLNTGSSRYSIDTSLLERDRVYIFPDPNVYGNVGVNTQDDYPLVYVFDYRDNIRDISSGVAAGDPKITNKNLTIEPYSTKQRDIQELDDLNELSYRLNFTDLYNKGAIRKMAYDCFGNEYALLKPVSVDPIDASTNAECNILLSMQFNGHTFNDTLFGEAYNFDYTQCGCNFGTIRAGIATNTGGFEDDGGLCLNFRRFTPYEELRGVQTCVSRDQYVSNTLIFGVDESVVGTEQSNITIIDGTCVDGLNFAKCSNTDGSGNIIPNCEVTDTLPTDSINWPDNDNNSYYYDIFTDAFDHGTGSWSDVNFSELYDGGTFTEEIRCRGVGDFFDDTVDESSTTLYAAPSVIEELEPNVGRLLQEGQIYFKDQGTSLSYPISRVLDNVFSKYSPTVQQDVLFNLINFDVIGDSIFLETPGRILIDKLNYNNGIFEKPNTQNNIFEIDRDDTLEVFSNRLYVDQVKSCKGEDVVLFAIFKTIKVDPETGQTLPADERVLYPEIHKYNLQTHTFERIYTAVEDAGMISGDLCSFTANNIDNISSNSYISAEKIATPVLSYNGSRHKLKLTYIIFDQNNLAHVNDCLFEWRVGKLQLRQIVKYRSTSSTSRTNTFSEFATFAQINDVAGQSRVSPNLLDIAQNHNE